MLFMIKSRGEEIMGMPVAILYEQKLLSSCGLSKLLKTIKQYRCHLPSMATKQDPSLRGGNIKLNNRISGKYLKVRKLK
jgi:hypothetical protein